MTSFRPSGDKAWNYVRESPKLSPYLRWVPRGPKLFECTVLSGWPAKVASNQPDGSYATKDLFEPHTTIERAWKYIARLDDTIALVNGEKFNPVMMEGKIRSHKAVTETVIFGAGRPNLGLLVVPSEAVAELTDDEIVSQIWPVIEDANCAAEAYARLSRDMVVVLPRGCEFPRTDKGSVIRQAFYKRFAAEIENAYDRAATASGELKALSIAELEVFVRETLAKSLPEAKDVDTSTDFFSLGLDSLQSIQMRNEILKTVDVGNNKLGQNVVFDYPSIASLSAHLHSLRTGQTEEKISISTKMQNLIAKHSHFAPAIRRDAVLTGATGSLGAHVLAQLIARPDIEKVYCLVRANSIKDATHRVQKSLIQRNLHHSLPLAHRRKIHCLPSDLSDPYLGLDSATHRLIASNLATVIHCAWSVNFNFNLSTFEKDCISGVRHLINLCLSTPSKPASFDFCSSVSTVARCPDLHTPEVLAELDWAQGMGYAQSKCVSEHLCMAAARQHRMKARVLRVGQIVADTVHGVWNSTEAIPLIMQSALTTGALPKLQEKPSWTPVDVVAKAVAEIALSDADSVVANVTNPKTFDWTNELLPALREAGLEFEEVEPREWVKRLAQSSDDAVSNPSKKLLEFFRSKYDKDTFSASRTYETGVACGLSPALAHAPVLDGEFVRTFVKQFQAGSWKTAETSVKGTRSKQVIVLAGPCGSGKSTVAKQLSAAANVPFIEGDELHSSDAVAQMAAGTPLDDASRGLWLGRLKQRALFCLKELGYDQVFVSCSALKQIYRDQLRELNTDADNVTVVFVDLQVEKDEMVRRMKNRGDHYMKEDMVESQVGIKEESRASEMDVLPVDAGKPVADVVEEITALLTLI